MKPPARACSATRRADTVRADAPTSTHEPAARPGAGAAGAHRRIAGGLLAGVLLVLLARSVGAAKEIAIAYRYGVSEIVDAYVFVLNLAGWPASVLLSLAPAVLAPLVAGRIARAGEVGDDREGGASPRFVGELVALAAVVGLGLGVATAALLWAALHFGATGLAPATRELALGMVMPLSAIVPLGAVMSVYAAWLIAHGARRVTLLEALPAACVLAAVLLLGGRVAEPLALATLAGFALQLLALAWPVHRRGGAARPRLAFSAPAWPAFRAAFGALAFAHLVGGSAWVIDQWLAAREGTGAVASMGYATRLVSLAIGVGTVAIGRAALPVFVESRASGAARRLALGWAVAMGLAGALVLALGWPAAQALVALVYERGAFGPGDTRVVGELVAAGLVQVPLCFAATVLYGLLASEGRSRALAIGYTMGIAVKLAASVAGVALWGLPGLMFATAVMHASLLAAWAVALRRTRVARGA